MGLLYLTSIKESLGTTGANSEPFSSSCNHILFSQLSALFWSSMLFKLYQCSFVSHFPIFHRGVHIFSWFVSYWFYFPLFLISTILTPTNLVESLTTFKHFSLNESLGVLCIPLPSTFRSNTAELSALFFVKFLPSFFLSLAFYILLNVDYNIIRHWLLRLVFMLHHFLD